MKKLLLLSLALLVFSGFAQVKPKKKVHNQNKVKELPDSVPVLQNRTTSDKIDEQMKGPQGEAVYIGSKGRRYYLKGTQKIYIPVKHNTKKNT